MHGGSGRDMRDFTKCEQTVEAEAAAWVVRLDAGPLDPAVQQAFEAWLEKSETHSAAFALARTTWAELEGLRGAPRGAVTTLLQTAEQRQSVPAPLPRRPVSRRWVWHSLAASVLLAVGLGAYQGADPLIALRADYWTAPGATRTIMLPDGSTVQLNTDSAIALRYGADRRGIELLEGEASFSVAKVANGDRRPFVVSAAGGTIRALGTRFVVHRQDVAVDVTVLDHRVEVSASEGAVIIRPGIILHPAQAVRYDSQSGLGEVRRIDPERATAWLQDRLVFDKMPLAQAVAELNRYRRGRIVIMAPALARRRVSGVFRLDDLHGAIDIIATELGARVVTAPFITALY